MRLKGPEHSIRRKARGLYVEAMNGTGEAPRLAGNGRRTVHR